MVAGMTDAHSSPEPDNHNGTDTDPIDRIAVIRAEAQRFADVLADTAPDAHCPTCPEWTAADLLWHLTEVHTFWARILGGNVTSDEDADAVDKAAPERPGTMAEMLPVRAHATESLLAQLQALDDAAPRWTWWPADQTVGFTRRMQTYEATMHRVDAELAGGVAVSPIDGAVAAGAVDHCVDVMWGWLPDWAVYEPLTVAGILATDSDYRCVVEVGHWTGTGPESGTAFDMWRAVRAQPDATAAVTVTGPLQDLALWAWTRGGDVQIDGDPAGVAAVQALIDQGIK